MGAGEQAAAPRPQSPARLPACRIEEAVLDVSCSAVTILRAAGAIHPAQLEHGLIPHLYLRALSTNSGADLTGPLPHGSEKEPPAPTPESAGRVLVARGEPPAGLDSLSALSRPRLGIGAEPRPWGSGLFRDDPTRRSRFGAATEPPFSSQARGCRFGATPVQDNGGAVGYSTVLPAAARVPRAPGPPRRRAERRRCRFSALPGGVTK